MSRTRHPHKRRSWIGHADRNIRIELASFEGAPKWVILDEIQKVPKLLDVVHSLIETNKQKFILTGSSARKLKSGAANLLAGRAFVYNLHPLTSVELGQQFDLEENLRWGTLPAITSFENDREKKSYLNAYVQTYFAEEIKAEQLLRKLDPFRAFLPILGQVSGKVINHNKIAKQIGTSVVTVQSYFQIVEDTLLGFYLPAFHESARKSQRLSPKFYLFDTGVKKAMEGSLDQAVTPKTSVFGELFEAFLVNEVYRLNHYFELDYRLSFFATKNNVEVDLILSKGQKHMAVEIKSADEIDEAEVRALSRNTRDIPGLAKKYYVSRQKLKVKIEDVECLHWQEFLGVLAGESRAGE